MVSQVASMPLPARRCALLTPHSAGRVAAEAFIRSVYLERYRATIAELPPILFVLYGPDEQILATAGLRPAVSGRLFLEIYLDEPADVVISRHAGLFVERTQLIEVGSLATRGPGYSRTLIQSLTELLYLRRFDWVVFTAVRSLRNTFHRLGLNPLPLCVADPARLALHADDWGTYYQCGPAVMYGNIAEGYRCLQTSRPAGKTAHSLVANAALIGRARA